MLRGVNSRLRGAQNRFELAGTEMTPSTLRGMTVARQFGFTFRATGLRTFLMTEQCTNLGKSSFQFNVCDFTRG